MKPAAIIKKENKGLKVIAIIGTLGGPAGIVAIICGALNISPTKTAILALLSVLISMVCVYSEFINRYIKSSLLLVLVLFSMIGYEFMHINPVLSETGLISYYKIANDFLGENLNKAVRDTKEEIIFFGTSFHISAGDIRPLLLSKLKQGVKVKYLVLNPFSEHLNNRAKDFNSTLEELQGEMKVSITSILLLGKQWEKISQTVDKPGVFELRIYNSIPSFRAYLLDPNSQDSKSYIVPYINRVEGPNSPGYLVRNKEGGILSFYHSGFLKMWQGAKTINEFQKSYPQYINLN